MNDEAYFDDFNEEVSLPSPPPAGVQSVICLDIYRKLVETKQGGKRTYIGLVFQCSGTDDAEVNFEVRHEMPFTLSERSFFGKFLKGWYGVKRVKECGCIRTTNGKLIFRSRDLFRRYGQAVIELKEHKGDEFAHIANMLPPTSETEFEPGPFIPWKERFSDAGTSDDEASEEARKPKAPF